LNRPVSDEYRSPLRASGFEEEKNQLVTMCERILVNGEVSHSKSHTQVKERNSYPVLLEEVNQFSIEANVILSKC